MGTLGNEETWDTTYWDELSGLHKKTGQLGTVDCNPSIVKLSCLNQWNHNLHDGFMFGEVCQNHLIPGLWMWLVSSVLFSLLLLLLLHRIVCQIYGNFFRNQCFIRSIKHRYFLHILPQANSISESFSPTGDGWWVDKLLQMRPWPVCLLLVTGGSLKVTATNCWCPVYCSWVLMLMMPNS